MNMKVIFIVMDTEIKAFFGHWQKQEKKSNASMSRGSWAIELNTRRKNSISTRSIYLDRSSNTVQGFWFIRVYPTLKVSQRFSVAAYNNKACAPSLKSDKTVRSHFDHSANRDPIMLAKRDGAVYKISPLQLPLSRRNSNEFFFTKTPINCGRL